MSSAEENVFEEVGCPLGCSRNDDLILVGRDLIHGSPGEFAIVRCATCGLMRTNPRPTPNAIGSYYPDDYGPYLGTRVQATRPYVANWFRRLVGPLVRRIVELDAGALPVMPEGLMLEIGCASGAFMHRMVGQGWRVQGIEFSPKAAKAAQELGYSVHVGPLETAATPDEPFDLIVGWMVLEHLHEPVLCLQKLRDWAKAGAWLVISVPNAGALSFRCFKNLWYDAHLPNHLYHFTPKTLSNVLKAGGWRVEKISHHRSLNNIIVSIGYVLRDKGHARLAERFIDYPNRGGAMVYALYPLAWLLSIFGQTGRMTVHARAIT